MANCFETVTVTTQYGRVRGSVRYNDSGCYCAFQGIPYAAPPTGNLRFKDPQPPEGWTNIREAIGFASISPQISYLRVSEGEESCLCLNVYTPEHIKTTNKRAVIVWLHGGGFDKGDPNIHYGPEYLIEENLIVVTVTYRLGILGFLNLETNTAAGNQALKDQIMALKWVKANIAHFGGDPKNVTLAGDGTGAACAHYLSMSPLARGLFHKVILQGGVATNAWALIDRPKMYAVRLCEKLGKITDDSEEILEFLQRQNLDNLIYKQNELLSSEEKMMLQFAFGPSQDQFAHEPVMPVDVEQMSDHGIQMPLLIGCAEFEGLIFRSPEYLEFLDINKFNSQIENAIHPAIREVLNKNLITLYDVKNFYFGRSDIVCNEQFVKLIGDLYFKLGIHRLLKAQVDNAKTPTFFYRYTFDNPNQPTVTKRLREIRHPGATRGSELNSLFKSGMASRYYIQNMQPGCEDYTVMTKMTELWANFARNGYPTSWEDRTIDFNWEPLIDNNIEFKYLQIDNEFKMQEETNILEIYKKL